MLAQFAKVHAIMVVYDYDCVALPAPAAGTLKCAALRELTPLGGYIKSHLLQDNGSDL